MNLATLVIFPLVHKTSYLLSKLSAKEVPSSRWRNGSGGRAAGLYTLVKPEGTGSIPGVSHKFRIARIIIPA